MSDKKPKSIPIKNLRQEEGASELASSPDMEPYLKLTMAGMQHGADISPHMAEIAQLPVERRYVWRVASALKWAFADFDNVNVTVDRQTLKQDDMAEVMELLKHRPLQFCMFLKALVGAEGMERLMTEGIAIAKQVD
ncbi:MAG: hypothetical protein LAO55_18785 [Acidobacteriia bacterium]|nr:hypothetical protein [Terriglobia bacterium]